MWSLMRSLWSNLITPTLVPSDWATPLFIVNKVQWKIGTGRELAEDRRPRIQTGLRMPRRGSKAGLRMERSPRWCCPCSGISKKKGCCSMPIGELKLRSISRRVTRITRSRRQCCSPWRERLAGISGIVMNMVTCRLPRSSNGWTCPIMPPWTSETSMPGCAASSKVPSSPPRIIMTTWWTSV